MINFNPPLTLQTEAKFLGAPEVLHENMLALTGSKCGICGGTFPVVGKIAGQPETHCAACRMWLRDAIRLLFFTVIPEWIKYPTGGINDGKA